MKPNLTEAQILVKVEEYLKGTRHTVESSTCGLTVFLTIDYVDFKPRRQVRDEIEGIAPNCEVEEIRRGYSHASIAQAVFEFDESHREVFMKLDDGTIQRVTLESLVNSVLQGRYLDKYEGDIAGLDYTTDHVEEESE